MVFSKLCSSFEQWKLHKLLCLYIGNYSALMLSPSGIGNCGWDTCNKLLRSALKFLSEKCLTVGLAKWVITAQLCRKDFPHPSLHRDGAMHHPLLHGTTGTWLPIYVNKESCCAGLLKKKKKHLNWSVWHFTLTLTSLLACPQLASHLFPAMVCPIQWQCQKPSASSPLCFCLSCLVGFHCCLISEQNFLLNWYA